MIRLSIIVLAGLVVAMTNVRDVSAAPQVLAALPAGGSLALVCDDGICEAEFSAICLQPERRLPVRGTAYAVFDEDLDAVVVSGVTHDGRLVSLPSTLVSLASHRDQTAVRVFVDSAVLADRGLQSISVDFDRMIALVPVPKEDGLAPQSAAEIADAVDGVRQVGAIWAENNADNLTIARITARIGNGLPKSGPVANAVSDRLLQIAVDLETDLDPGVLHSANKLVALCQRRSGITPMRSCIEGIHDQVMRSLNGKYWSATSPSS